MTPANGAPAGSPLGVSSGGQGGGSETVTIGSVSEGPSGAAAAGQPTSAEFRSSLRILLVDDDRTLREGCASVLQIDGYNVTTTGRGDEAIDMLKRRKFDIVLVDLYLTPVSGMDILRAALEAHRDTIVIVMTGNPSVVDQHRGAACRGLGLSAQAVLRAAHADPPGPRVARRRGGSGDARVPLRSMVEQHGNSDRITLLGISPAFRQAVELARKVAPTDASVMISGESGTGKELIAQFIHRHSRRASRKLVPINCAALPEPLLESEMFGHRKGAFTGADRDKPGLLETANGGHAVPGRADGDVASAPGQAAACAAGRCGAARGQRAAGCGGRRALHLGHQPRAAGGGQRRRAARGSVLPSARGADQAPAAPEAAGGHSRSWPTISWRTTGSGIAPSAMHRPS